MHKLTLSISALALAAALAACSPAEEAEPDAAMTDEAAMTEDMTAAVEEDPVDVTASQEMTLAERIAMAERPDADTQIDQMRRPAEVLTFAGVEEGWNVADLGAGGGYYTRVLSAAVGESGHVHSQNFDWIVSRYPQVTQAMDALEANYGNVTSHVTTDTAPLEGMETPLDAVFIVLLYHDVLIEEGEDIAAMNRAIHDGLRPGGVYVIVDHSAREGTGTDDSSTLHRVEESLVRSQVEAAGFEFVGESDVLANIDDDMTLNVFDESIRRQTDRFVLLFRKPE